MVQKSIFLYSILFLFATGVLATDQNEQDLNEGDHNKEMVATYLEKYVSYYIFAWITTLSFSGQSVSVGDAMDYFVYLALFAGLGWFENQVKTGYKSILLLGGILFSAAYALQFSETLHLAHKHVAKGSNLAIMMAIYLPLLFIGSKFLRYTVFLPLRFTNWIATMPKVRSILRWVVDNMFHIFLVGLFSDIPLSISGAIPYIAAASVTQLALISVDKLASYAPEFKGKTYVILIAKAGSSFAIFPNVYQTIDAELFKPTKIKAFEEFNANVPDLEIPNCLDQAKNNFSKCNRLLSDFHWDSQYENPKILIIDCSKLDPQIFVETLKNDMRCLVNFPKEGNFKECHNAYKTCVRKYHPDKSKGSNLKFYICQFLERDCKTCQN